MPEVELLVPAGNEEKLRVAVAYGADAVYFAGEDFSLRRHAGNFPTARLPEVVSYCRRRGVKAYLAVNAYLHPGELAALTAYLEEIANCPPDALIVTDPGILVLCREILPEVPLHLSTQANTTNQQALLFWARQGVRRCNLARELSLREIEIVRREAPGIELEVFVHGAMCVAYSGRCLLSAALAGRSANRGDCAHPCRWRYTVMEAKRPGEYLPVDEDDRGTYVFSSRDLCLLACLPRLLAAGVNALKIEGRMKSSYYLAVVTRAYRRCLDGLLAGKPLVSLEELKNELTMVSHRGYSTGFMAGRPGPEGQDLAGGYRRTHQYVALVQGVEEPASPSRGTEVRLAVKDRLKVGERLQVLDPGGHDFSVEILALRREDGTRLTMAHPGQQARALVAAAGMRPLQLFHRPC